MLIEQPLIWYTDEDQLRFYLLSVGEGLMTLIIFPNKEVMLFDCNVTNENEDVILNFLEEVIPKKYNDTKEKYEKAIDIFVNSHRDEDHYRGLKKVNLRFPIKSIWDSGQSGATTSSSDYKYYMYLRRELKSKNPDNLLVPTPSNIPVGIKGGVEIFCLAAEEDFTYNYLNKFALESYTRIQHTNSMVLMLEYGGRKLLLTGDSDWKSWKEKIIPNFKENNFLESNILIASHHGSRSFFTDESNDNIDIKKNPDTTYIESIEYIKPDITLISCGKYESASHPNKEALKIYKKYTSESQVYTTYNKGHLSGFIDNKGNFTVVPSRFKNLSNIPLRINFEIKCLKINTNEKTEKEIMNNTNVSVGCKLKFTIQSQGGLIEPFNKVKVFWEVSNGGKGISSFHQEIYLKDKTEPDDKLSFSRDLTYIGTHLLRCRVINEKKGYDLTRIFIINGI